MCTGALAVAAGCIKTFPAQRASSGRATRRTAKNIRRAAQDGTTIRSTPLTTQHNVGPVRNQGKPPSEGVSDLWGDHRTIKEHNPDRTNRASGAAFLRAVHMARLVLRHPVTNPNQTATGVVDGMIQCRSLPTLRLWEWYPSGHGQA